MIESLRYMIRAVIPLCFSLVFMLSAGSVHAVDKVFTIGIINSVTVLDPVVDGFEEGMADLGYVADKDVRYIYRGVIEDDEEEADAEIRYLLSQGIDVLLAVGNEMTLAAKKDLDGTDIPVITGACIKPVEAGLINSMIRPGGNITGVAVADTAPKALELLKELIPDVKKVYLPYNPDDKASTLNLTGLDGTASLLGIEVIYHRIRSFEEAVRAIGELPDDVNAVFRIPSPTLDSRSGELTRAAIERGIPVCARVPLDEDVLLTFATDLRDLGKATARLAHQVLQGVKASDLPVEVQDVFLTINLKTAERLGIDVPDSILFQAETIIR